MIEHAEYDVVVCGGGPAGIAAAFSAGRAGAKTLLLERSGCLGGTMCDAFLSSFCDSPGGTFLNILANRLLENDAAFWRTDRERYRPPGRLSFHSESMRAIALEMVIESGADVLFFSPFIKPIVEKKCLKGVFFGSKRGISAARAGVVVDCTGDGDVAAGAGAAFLQGDDADGRIQMCNFRWIIGGISGEARSKSETAETNMSILFKKAVADGEIRAPEYAFSPSREAFPFDIESGKLLMTNWELKNVDPTDIRQVSKALVQCQTAALQVVRFCRKKLPGYEHCRIERFPSSLGARESRRIAGHYKLTGNDVVAGRKFNDGIAKAWFWIDFHDPPPGKTVPYGADYIKANRPPPDDWFEIPYRSLIPRGIAGLLIAGRCISSDRAAQASLRVIPTCMFTGAAAGTAAAYAALRKIPLSALDGRELKERMIGK